MNFERSFELFLIDGLMIKSLFMNFGISSGKFTLIKTTYLGLGNEKHF